MENNNETLIDYLDQRLSDDEKLRVENQLKKDKVVAGELEYLKMAVDMVRRDAIQARVSAVREKMNVPLVTTKKNPGAVVRSMFRSSLRIAAAIILFMGVAIIYKYTTVSNGSVYKKQFQEFDLNNTRGLQDIDAESSAYRNKNWNEVINAYQNAITKSNQSAFLAGMAYMERGDFQHATTIFENILAQKSGDLSFHDEAEYYLSLSYLMNHEEGKSVQMLNKIKADTSHTYYPLAFKTSALDLKIIKLKNK